MSKILGMRRNFVKYGVFNSLPNAERRIFFSKRDAEYETLRIFLTPIFGWFCGIFQSSIEIQDLSTDLFSKLVNLNIPTFSIWYRQKFLSVQARQDDFQALYSNLWFLPFEFTWERRTKPDKFEKSEARDFLYGQMEWRIYLRFRINLYALKSVLSWNDLCL